MYKCNGKYMKAETEVIYATPQMSALADQFAGVMFDVVCKKTMGLPIMDFK